MVVLFIPDDRRWIRDNCPMGNSYAISSVLTPWNWYDITGSLRGIARVGDCWWYWIHRCFTFQLWQTVTIHQYEIVEYLNLVQSYLCLPNWGEECRKATRIRIQDDERTDFVCRWTQLPNLSWEFQGSKSPVLPETRFFCTWEKRDYVEFPSLLENASTSQWSSSSIWNQ